MTIATKDTFLLDNDYTAVTDPLRQMLNQCGWNWKKLPVLEDYFRQMQDFLTQWQGRLADAVTHLTQSELLTTLEKCLDEAESQMVFVCLLPDWTEECPSDFDAASIPKAVTDLLALLDDVDAVAHGRSPVRVHRNEAALQAKAAAAVDALYQSGWRAEVFGDEGGNAEAAAQDRKNMKRFRRKDGDAKRIVDLDFGMHNPVEWHCPVCGQKLFDFEKISDNFCKHALIACVNGEEINWNDVGDDMIEGRRPDLVPTEIFVNKEFGPRPYEVLKAAYSTGTNFILSETAGGMGCGPIWNTVEILFECKDEVLEAPEKDAK